MDCFAEEKLHLEMVEAELKQALAGLAADVVHYEQEYKEARRYLADSWNELDTMERFANERSVNQIVDGGEGAEKMRRQVEATIDSPYFGRVDFCFDGEAEAEVIYIGRFGFCDQWGQSLIYDWRAPVSSLYYDFELERGSFEAPMGTVNGDIRQKRQLKIVDGELAYVVESGMAIGDEILQQELSRNADERMKTIIATIQKEQNQLIRDTKAHNLIIQGAAGSGKTSIALHRAAYLLYRQRETLLAGSVAIFSPNKVFADYISTVLPQLGETPLLELSFQGLAAEEIGDELEYEWVGTVPQTATAVARKGIRFKTGWEFLQAAKAYWQDAQQRLFQPGDLNFGRVQIGKADLKRRYEAWAGLPIRQRFSQMTGEIIERCKTEGGSGEKPPTWREVERRLEGMFQVKSTLALYEDFYRSLGREEYLVNPGSSRKEWWDVYPYLYFKGLFTGLTSQPSIQHLIVDEMQDYSPVQYAVLDQLFPCSKTILGDFYQQISGGSSLTLAQFKEIFGRVEIREITKSYRSTKEIVEFARNINPASRAEPIERHGEPPAVLAFDSHEAELEYLQERVDAHGVEASGTMAILLKEAEAATRLWQQLASCETVHLLTEQDTKFKGGVTITTIAMSKGLEFDEVILPFAENDAYVAADVNLLYVACTRALHRLTITYQKELTRLISDTH